MSERSALRMRRLRVTWPLRGEVDEDAQLTTNARRVIPATASRGSGRIASRFFKAVARTGASARRPCSGGVGQGSVSFGIESGLFTGDTLFRGKVGRTDLPGGDAQALAVSLELLAQMPGDPQVFPGHGDRTTIEAEVASNPRLKSLRDAVIAAAHSGGTS